MIHWVAILLALVLWGSPAFSESVPQEMPGAKDHPALSRYTGSVLHDYATENFASVLVPQGPGERGPDSKLTFKKSTTVEGKVYSYFYVQPKDRSPLEVFRNYQSALQKAGFSLLYSCELEACRDGYIRESYAGEVVYARKWKSGSNSAYSAVSADVRFLSAKGTRNGTDIYALVLVGEPYSTWQAATTVVLIAEPAPLEEDKVVANIEALQRGLESDGKIALYGIYFDTGKADIKPESKVQLDEMGKLLHQNKTLKVFIVGHTDNQGSLDLNLALSQKRADAVVAALVRDYKVDSARVAARGVANFSPVASNRGDAGRAKNRRVELVEQ